MAIHATAKGTMYAASLCEKEKTTTGKFPVCIVIVIVHKHGDVGRHGGIKEEIVRLDRSRGGESGSVTSF